MAHNGSNPFLSGRQNWRQGGFEAKTLAGAYTLVDSDSQAIAMDPGGAARVVTLPPEETHDGAWFEIYNAADAAESLTIKNDAASTILVLQQGESGKVGCTGAAWIVIGTPTEGGSDFSAAGIAADVVAESTAAAGVTVDGLLIKDGDALFVDSDKAIFGTGSDIAITWDATKLAVTQAAPNSAVHWGIDGAGIDHVFYGDTASASLTWDQSADKLLVAGVASVQGLRTSSSTAVAITGATALTLADAGGTFTVSQAAAYDIDLPSPTTGAGCRYFFHLTGPAANAVTLTVLGGAATFVGTITIDGATIPATGETLTFASGASVLGDSIEIQSLTTGLYHVRAISSGTGGITIA